MPRARASRAATAITFSTRAGSQVAIGTAWERIPSNPVFGTPFGLSAVPRFVQVIAGTIALKAELGSESNNAAPTQPPRIEAVASGIMRPGCEWRTAESGSTWPTTSTGRCG